MMIPHTDWERLEILNEIERGEKVVIPTSIEHAKFMISVAQDYITKEHRKLLSTIKYSDK